MSVSEDDPRPAYSQVADDLRQRIDRGEFRPGQRIPSGRDLAKTYEVALLTVQKAVDHLKATGLLVSHPPRGVFVAADGDAATQAPTQPPSPEYEAIMSHLDSLETALRDHIADVDRRLTALEQAARKPRPRSKPAR